MNLEQPLAATKELDHGGHGDTEKKVPWPLENETLLNVLISGLSGPHYMHRRVLSTVIEFFEVSVICFLRASVPSVVNFFLLVAA